MPEDSSRPTVSGSAIIIGSLVGIALLLVIAALGGALGTTLDAQKDVFEAPPARLAIGFFTTLVLTLVFFVAGFISAKISPSKQRSDSVIQALGAWALISLLVVILSSFGSAIITLRDGLRGLQPVITTELHLSNPAATSKIKVDEVQKQKKEAEEKKSARKMALMWWVVFSSLSTGGAAAAGAGLLAHRRSVRSRRS